MTDDLATAASWLPGELRVLAVRLEALGMNARPLWDAAKLAAAHAKEETSQGKQEPASNLGVSEQARLLSGDAGLSAEREARVRKCLEEGRRVIWADARDLLATLDAERERRRRAEQQAETLAEALRFWVDRADWFEANLRPVVTAAYAVGAGYRTGRDEAKP